MQNVSSDHFHIVNKHFDIRKHEEYLDYIWESITFV